MSAIVQEHQQRRYTSKNDIDFRYRPGEEVGVQVGYKCDAEGEKEEGRAPEDHLQQEKKNNQEDDELHKGEREHFVAAVSSDTEIHIRYEEESDKHDSDPLRDGQSGNSG